MGRILVDADPTLGRIARPGARAGVRRVWHDLQSKAIEPSRRQHHVDRADGVVVHGGLLPRESTISSAPEFDSQAGRIWTFGRHLVIPGKATRPGELQRFAAVLQRLRAAGQLVQHLGRGCRSGRCQQAATARGIGRGHCVTFCLADQNALRLADTTGLGGGNAWLLRRPGRGGFRRPSAGGAGSIVCRRGLRERPDCDRLLWLLRGQAGGAQFPGERRLVDVGIGWLHRELPHGLVAGRVRHGDPRRQSLDFFACPPDFLADEMGRRFAGQHALGSDGLPALGISGSVFYFQRLHADRVVDGGIAAEDLAVRALPHPGCEPRTSRVHKHPHVGPLAAAGPPLAVDRSQAEPVFAICPGLIGKRASRWGRFPCCLPRAAHILRHAHDDPLRCGVGILGGGQTEGDRKCAVFGSHQFWEPALFGRDVGRGEQRPQAACAGQAGQCNGHQQAPPRADAAWQPEIQAWQ